ncbi:MAG: sigma-54 dependent transcriptional regulator [Mariniphaga sp.]
MVKMGKILAIDDNEDILFSLRLLLKPHVEKIITSNIATSIPELLKNEDFDVILLDMNFTKDAISGQEGFFWLKKILEIDPSAVVLFITAYGDIEKSVRAIKEGASDFILKPWQNEKLLATLNSAMNLRKSKMEIEQLKSRAKAINNMMNRTFKDFIGNSVEMQKVYNSISKVATTDASVLILGENGTGKELVARALHQNSSRSDETFISVDLTSISESLFESELFGHTKGSFTDAKADRPGRFEIAAGGTLFLDEIGNLPMPLQAKILTVLERREVIRVGSNKPIPIDIRLICATNMPLHQMIEEGKFRQDLLYRINTVEIDLPPLRERYGDVPLLAVHFFQIYAKKYKKQLRGFTKEAMKRLEESGWPGNVRELQHVIERAVIMTESEWVNPNDLQMRILNKTSDDLELDNYDLEKVEKTIIIKVMKMHQGNISKAASELGLTRTSLYRRMEKYGL